MTEEKQLQEWQKIPHLKVTVGGYDLRCPVVITRRGKPDVCNGEYVYALPGGGRISATGVILGA